MFKIKSVTFTFQTYNMRIFFLFFLLPFAPLKNTSKKNADLIVYNGNIYTVNEKFDTAQAFAVSNGKIIEVGRN